VRSQPLTALAARRLQTTLVTLLAASGASTFTILPDGSVTESAGPLLGRPVDRTAASLLDLPDDLRLRDLDLVALVAGEPQSGVDGDRAYVAIPLAPVNGATP